MKVWIGYQVSSLQSIVHASAWLVVEIVIAIADEHLKMPIYGHLTLDVLGLDRLYSSSPYPWMY